MDDSEKKYLKEMMNTAFEDIELDAPSSHFTENVMNQIKALESETSITYQPLISKRILVTFSLLLMIGTVFLATKADLTSTAWFGDLDISKYTSTMVWPELKIPISNTVFYGILAFGIMVFVQTKMLKGYLDKRLA